MPDASRWQRSPADDRLLAQALGEGRIVAWVQGRWEIGPRALGNRSILAEPFGEDTRQRLNAIKQREQYRPIAPACRVEDLAAAFHEDFDDPCMLYFRRVREEQGLRAVTHVDGSARVQTVSRSSNRRLHDLLSQFARLRTMPTPSDQPLARISLRWSDDARLPYHRCRAARRGAQATLTVLL